MRLGLAMILAPALAVAAEPPATIEKLLDGCARSGKLASAGDRDAASCQRIRIEEGLWEFVGSDGRSRRGSRSSEASRGRKRRHAPQA